MKSFKKSDIARIIVIGTDGKQYLCEYGADNKLVPINVKTPEPVESVIGMVEKKTETGGSSEFATILAPVSPAEAKPSPAPEPEPKPKALPPLSDSVFRARLSSIMTDNKFDRNLRGRTRGKLDMRRLWKAEVGATNLFMQKQARKNKEYNVLILVDESGSMVGGRIKVAAECVTFLGQSFEGLNINLAVVGFNRLVHKHKDFEEKVDWALLKKQIVHNANNGGHRGYNNDYDALAYAYKMFKGRSGQNFLIMLSDGDPALFAPDIKGIPERIAANDEEFVYKKDLMGKRHEFYYEKDGGLTWGQKCKTENFHRLVHSNSNVESIGVGIQAEGWQIPNHFRINNLEELKPQILAAIQKKVKRG